MLSFIVIELKCESGVVITVYHNLIDIRFIEKMVGKLLIKLRKKL